jgi:PAS domain S-box-containing protein
VKNIERVKAKTSDKKQDDSNNHSMASPGPSRANSVPTLCRQKGKVIRRKVAPIPERLAALSPEEAFQLVVELRVNQIELEIQYDEVRRLQGELSVARERYVNLYDLSPVGYVTLSDQGLILEANVKTANLLGLTKDFLLKQPLTSFVLPEDQDIYYRYCKLLFEAGAPQGWEMRMLRANIAPFWVRIEAAMVQEGGMPLCHAVLTDIAERRESEGALRRSEEHFRRFTGESPLGCAS